MLAERLGKAWRAHRGSIAIDAVMRFSDEGLVLGAGTVLAKADAAAGRDISIDPGEPRLLALLAAAHMRSPTAESLAHLRKAAQRWSEGQEALAHMHLALSRLDRLKQPEADAHRLFLADELLKAGFEARAIVAASEAGEPAFERLHKYDPNQPRVPAGSGRPSGEWTSTGGGPFASPSGPNRPRPLPQDPGPVPETHPSQTLAQPQPDVNPSTVTPVGNTRGSYEGPDACFKARTDCQLNVSQAQWKGNANNNRNMQTFFKCGEQGVICDLIELAVNYTPFFSGGGVIFPDGGVVLVNGGSEPVYYPREISALKWPLLHIPDL
jgi:hypothetical protein